MTDRTLTAFETGTARQGGGHRLLLGKFRSGHVVPLSRMCFQTVRAPRNSFVGEVEKCYDTALHNAEC